MTACGKSAPPSTSPSPATVDEGRADRQYLSRPVPRSEHVEEIADLAGEQSGFLRWTEVAARFHGPPAPHVVQPLRPLSRRPPLEHELLREVGDPRRDTHEVIRPDRDPVPGVVEVVPHRAGYRSPHPEQRH